MRIEKSCMWLEKGNGAVHHEIKFILLYRVNVRFDNLGG